MSKKTNSASVVPNGIDTLIGAGMHVTGDIASTGVLRVQGTVLGNVSCDCSPNGFLVVDSAGAVTGTINTTRIAVRGSVVGPVQSAQSIEVHPGATVVGDISFKSIAIHAGGIVEGLLNPTAAMDENGLLEGLQPEVAAAGSSGFMDRHTHARNITATAAVAVIVAAVAWMSRDLLLPPRPADDVAPSADSSVKDSAAPRSLPAAGGEPRSAPKAVDADPAPLAPSMSVGANGAAPTSAPERQGNDEGKVVTVRGANPNRSASVFLLIGNQPTVVYKKKRDDPGDGARISVAQGEKTSVSIAPDELVRVAEGGDVVILYQGQKVARNTIESGSWISFVPR